MAVFSVSAESVRATKRLAWYLTAFHIFYKRIRLCTILYVSGVCGFIFRSDVENCQSARRLLYFCNVMFQWECCFGVVLNMSKSMLQKFLGEGHAKVYAESERAPSLKPTVVARPARGRLTQRPSRSK